MSREFWEQQHRENNELYLTGSAPAWVYAQHGVTELVEGPPKTIVEIGIGMGDSIWYLCSKGHRVLAVDISVVACARVAQVASIASPTQIPWTEPEWAADLVLCHLVIQHCDPDAAADLIGRAIQQLKPHDGLFSFQFAFRNERRPLPQWIQDGVDLGVLHWYTLEEIEGFVRGGGGEVVKRSPAVWWPDQQAVGWHYVWARRL